MKNGHLPNSRIGLNSSTGSCLSFPLHVQLGEQKSHVVQVSVHGWCVFPCLLLWTHLHLRLYIRASKQIPARCSCLGLPRTNQSHSRFKIYLIVSRSFYRQSIYDTETKSRALQQRLHSHTWSPLGFSWKVRSWSLADVGRPQRYCINTFKCRAADGMVIKVKYSWKVMAESCACMFLGRDSPTWRLGKESWFALAPSNLHKVWECLCTKTLSWPSERETIQQFPSGVSINGSSSVPIPASQRANRQ